MYKLNEVIPSLKRKNDVRISNKQKIVYIDRTRNALHDLGNGSHGKIDFLSKSGYKIRVIKIVDKKYYAIFR